VAQKDVYILSWLSLHIKLTQASVFQVKHSYSSKVLFPSCNGSSSKIIRAGEDQDCRGFFRDEICCPNRTTISEGLSGQKHSNQAHNKALGQLQENGKCTG